MAGEPSLLYTVIGVLLQLLPSIRRCNCYLIDLVVTKSPATTTSNQPTSRSGTNTRAAARISVHGGWFRCRPVLGHIVPVPVACTAISRGSREGKSSSGSSGADAGSRTVTGDGLVFGGSGGVGSPSGSSPDPNPNQVRPPSGASSPPIPEVPEVNTLRLWTRARPSIVRLSSLVADASGPASSARASTSRKYALS